MPELDLSDVITAVIAGGSAVTMGMVGVVGHVWSRMAKLEERMATLEKDNQLMRTLFEISVSFIQRVGIWMSGSTDERDRPEVPEQLREHVDTAPWK